MTRRRGFLLFVADHQSPAKLRQLSLVPLAHAQLLLGCRSGGNGGLLNARSRATFGLVSRSDGKSG